MYKYREKKQKTGECEERKLDMPTTNRENLKKKNVDEKEKNVTIIYDRAFIIILKPLKTEMVWTPTEER